MSDGANSVQLTLTAKIVGGTLRLHYVLENSGERAVYLLNVLWDHSPSGEVIRDRHPAYVSLPFDGKANVLIGALPLPKNKRVELRHVPYSTLLAAGAKLEQEAALPLPVEEYNWYYPADSDIRYGRAKAKDVRLTVHYLPESPQLERRAGPWADTWIVQHPRLFDEILSVNAAAETTSFDARPRVDLFGRF